MDFLPKFDIFVIFAELFWPNFLDCFLWQMLLSHFVNNHWMLLADVIASWLFMADVFSHCGRCESHSVFCLWKPQLMNCLVVADVMATLLIGWCHCHGGRWNYHIVWADVLPNITVGTATFVTAIWLVWIVADGIATFCDWLMLLPWWQVLWPLVGMW